MQAVQIIPAPLGGDLQIVPVQVNNSVEKKPTPVAIINSGTKLTQLRDNPLFSDAILEIPEVQRYPVHKAVLGISSEYFKTLFAGRFRQSSTIVLSEVEPQTVDLYLDMVYGKELVLYDWRQVMKLFMFAKFTQTDIPRQDHIIKGIKVSSQDFVNYVQELSAFYDGAIPLDIIAALEVPLSITFDDGAILRDIIDTFGVPPLIDGNNFSKPIYSISINFSDLGEEFTTALIETSKYEDMKYVIAQKAVKEGMSTALYGLVRMEKLTPGLASPESIPYLRKFDTSRLYATDVRNSGSMTLLIDNYIGDVREWVDVPYMLLRTKSRNNRRIVLAIPIRDVGKVDENGNNVIMAVSSDGTEQNIDEILNAVAIEAKSFHISQEVNDAVSRLRLDAHFGPIIVDKYELFN